MLSATFAGDGVAGSDDIASGPAEVADEDVSAADRRCGMGAVDLCRAVKQQSFGNRPVGFYADRLFHVLQPHQGSKDAHGCSQFLAGIFDSPGAAVAADLQLSAGTGLSGQAAASRADDADEFLALVCFP